MNIIDFFKNKSIFKSREIQNNNINLNNENKNNNEDDDCLTKFKEKINDKSNEWKKTFNEYVECKYKMFNKLKEKERKRDDLLQFGIIFSGALIPIVNVIIPLDEMEYTRIVVTTLLGFSVTIIVGFNQIKKYHERWTTFKGVSRALEFEYINLTKPKGIFIEEHEKNAYDNIISILQQEVKEVVSLFKDKGEDSNNKDNNQNNGDKLMKRKVNPTNEDTTEEKI